jgi:hypothetical protein
MSEEHPTTEAELIERVRAIDVRAPERLHEHVRALVDERSAQGRPALWAGMLGEGRGLAWRVGGGAAVAAAAVAVALVLALGGGSSSSRPLTLEQAFALTLRAATMPAPGESTHNPNQLAVSVDDVAFPYWEEHFGWRSSGAREDELDGRRVTTVFYTNGLGERVGYAIVAGPPPSVSGGVVWWHDEKPYRIVNESGTQVVTWTRGGHMCVVSGRGVDSGTLLELASWTGGQSS